MCCSVALFGNNLLFGDALRVLYIIDTTPPLFCVFVHGLGVCVCVYGQCVHLCLCVCMRVKRVRYLFKALLLHSWTPFAWLSANDCFLSSHSTHSLACVRVYTIVKQWSGTQAGRDPILTSATLSGTTRASKRASLISSRSNKNKPESNILILISLFFVACIPSEENHHTGVD